MLPCNSPLDLAAYFLFQSRSCASREVANRLLKDYARQEINALLWLWLVAATFLLLGRVHKLLRLWARARCIPGPPCSSFYGHTKPGLPQDFTDFLSVLHDKYGSIFKLWSSPMQLLVSVNNPVLAKEILFKAEDKFLCTGRALRLIFGQSNLFFCSYDKARRIRGSFECEFNQISTDKRNLLCDSAMQSIEEKIICCMDKGSMDCKSISQHMAFTILGTKIFGDSFLGCSSASSYEDLLKVIVKDAPSWSSYRVTPYWKLGFWRYEFLCKRLKYLTDEIARQCRDTCNFMCSPDDFSSSTNKRDGLKPTIGEESCGNIVGAMFHGSIALTALICSVFERLASDSRLQDEVYTEITSVRDQSIHTLALLLATIYESARLLPSKPLLQRCSLRKDLTLANGVRIPAGAIIIVPVHLLQTEISAWGSDARNFDPYRFLQHSREVSNASQGILKNLHPVLGEPTENPSFLPFGAGVRACVAQKFVIHAVASLSAAILARYEVKYDSQSGKGETNSEILFVKRNA